MDKIYPILKENEDTFINHIGLLQLNVHFEFDFVNKELSIVNNENNQKSKISFKKIIDVKKIVDLQFKPFYFDSFEENELNKCFVIATEEKIFYFSSQETEKTQNYVNYFQMGLNVQRNFTN
eukprot:TRINITY_DN3859_c0_g1_i1.p1 TRINITY_DN3859_c0_g1~~TRINITY_DN3859_c0_g1_i1.p1  ORF type:complete len:122 (+),score=33.11 TRINITY_DN3859_c0_g1_i1:350-715(+)